MSRDLIAQLKSLKEDKNLLTPDSAFVSKTRDMLHARVDLDRRQAIVDEKDMGSFINDVLPKKLFLTLRNSSLAVLVAVMAFGTFSGVSASQWAKPGQVLYPVKLASEGLQVSAAKLAGKKDVAVQLSLDFATRRVEEVKEVSAEREVKPEVVNKTVERLKKNLDSINTQLDEIGQEASLTRETAEKSEEAIALAKEVSERVDNIVTDLEGVKKDVSTKRAIEDVERTANETSLDAIDVVVKLDEEKETAKALVKEKLQKVAEKHAQTQALVSQVGEEEVSAQKEEVLSVSEETLSDEQESEEKEDVVSTTASSSPDTIETVASSSPELQQTKEEEKEEVSSVISEEEKTIHKIVESVDASIKEAEAAVEERPEDAIALLKEIHDLQHETAPLLKDVQHIEEKETEDKTDIVGEKEMPVLSEANDEEDKREEKEIEQENDTETLEEAEEEVSSSVEGSELRQVNEENSEEKEN